MLTLREVDHRLALSLIVRWKLTATPTFLALIKRIVRGLLWRWLAAG
jgi:hypothetical protein